MPDIALVHLLYLHKHRRLYVAYTPRNHGLYIYHINININIYSDLYKIVEFTRRWLLKDLSLRSLQK